MDEGKRGFLTAQQAEVLRLRLEGLPQEEIAKRLGTTRQNVSTVERRARNNVRLARETLDAYSEFTKAASLVVPTGTHLVDVPRLVIDAADAAGVRLRADFTRVYNEFRFKAPGHVDRTMVVKPVKVLIFKNGDIELAPGRDHEAG